MKKKLFFIISLYFFSIAFAPLHVFSQDTDMPSIALETFLFDEMVIVESTTMREEKTQESALNIKVINRDEIENYGIRTIKDLLMFIENGFETFKGRDRVYNIRGIMGYANDKIKFLIDGQEFPMMLGLGEGEIPVTLDEVKRIEIVKGPNTSLFGGNASQATINIIRYTGKDFVGVKTGLAIGSFNHKRGFVHYAERPSDNLDYDIYFSTATQIGPDVTHREWGTDSDYEMFKHDVTIPLPDHELIISTTYDNLRLTWRRVIERRNAAGDVYTHNYSDGVAAEYTKEDLFGNDNLDLIFSVEASNFGQQYDVYHNDPSMGSPIEHKAEKRLEWDAHILYTPADNWDLLAGISGNYWSATGTEGGVNYTLTTITTDLPTFDIATSLTSGVSTPEYFPSFTEVNDLADWELWADFKYHFNDSTSMVLGGRYVYDFAPNDQLRDSDAIAKYNTKRELLRKFFPKAAIVYSPQENMFIKLIYQEAFNRPNTFEQFSAWNTLSMRGTMKATTARTYELVLDWVISKNLKTLVTIFKTDYFDFVNFAYTGSGWPVVDASVGQIRGFINVGDREINGIEGNFELKYENYGGFISAGYLNKNKITNVVTGLSGATGKIDETDNNKQSAPVWDASIGAWVKLVDNVTLSTLYTTHQNAKTSEDWTGTVYERDINSWDIILNAKNVWRENLDFQILVKNILDADEFFGSALDPAHRELQWPRYYEGKITYLW